MNLKGKIFITHKQILNITTNTLGARGGAAG